MQVIWSKEANEQLVQIISYGTEHFGNNASLKLYRRFWNTTQLLASQPYMGKSEPLLAENPNHLIIKSYTASTVVSEVSASRISGIHAVILEGLRPS